MLASNKKRQVQSMVHGFLKGQHENAPKHVQNKPVLWDFFFGRLKLSPFKGYRVKVSLAAKGFNTSMNPSFFCWSHGAHNRVW